MLSDGVETGLARIGAFPPLWVRGRALFPATGGPDFIFSTLAEALLEIQAEGQFSAANRQRGAAILRLQQEARTSKGMARASLARFVEAKKRKLRSRNPDLTELAAFNPATDIVLKEHPGLLSDYRKDAEVLK